MLLNPPNILTLTRLALAPFVVRYILAGRHSTALTLFVAAAFTDVMDGGLARQFGWRTRAGEYLDPIADKVLLSGIYVALAAVRTIPVWFVALIFGRDLLILCSSGAALLLTRLRQFSPSVWGKASTFFQIVTAVAWMTDNATRHPAAHQVAEALIWPTTALTVWSGIHYGWRGLRLVRTD